MSPLPNVRGMARQAARHDVDRVDPNVVTGLLEARRQPLGGNDDATNSPGIERHCCGLLGRSSLDLDERQRSPTPCDNVDLAAGHAGPSREDPPATEAQPPAGDRLGAAATFFGSFAIHFERSRARA